MIEKIDFNDFMTNDDNPVLKRLVDQLLQDPEFQRIMKDNNIENNDEGTVD